MTEICKTSDEMQRIRKRMRDEREEMTTATKGFDYTTKILLLLKGNPHATGEDKQRRNMYVYTILHAVTCGQPLLDDRRERGNLSSPPTGVVLLERRQYRLEHTVQLR